MPLNAVVAVLALLSLALTVWQFLVARRFPLHRRVTDRSFTPAVTLLKPLKGREADTARCLESWLTQEYPAPVQVLFGVASADDPVCDEVRSLIARFPRSDAQLVICGESLGANAKVSTLIQLLRHARHELIVVSDADVRVPPDFLINGVAPLRDERVGLVNSFYRLANPATLAMRWEAVAINADFWSQVLQSQSLKPLDFALGAAMVTRRSELDAIGGFGALADCLADDYQLGRLISVRGKRILLSPVVVECWSEAMSWEQVWSHQLRWARTIRVCQPVPWFFSILSNATLWPLLWLLVQPTSGVVLAALGCLAVRVATASYQQAKLTGVRPTVATVWLAPLKDLLHALLWAWSFLGGHVSWRGERYRVQAGGRLTSTTAPGQATAPPAQPRR
ncbi:MAG: bacteriohopanetetrol glucosamine biosynthesis glycosyltransferase HpnI [Limisphaerales bacterium]